QLRQENSMQEDVAENMELPECSHSSQIPAMVICPYHVKFLTDVCLKMPVLFKL
ncbi:Hypothetical predicted protein, partial [Marmota monax]